MSLREKLENNIVIFFLTTLLTGFLAGIGTYQAILKITGLEVVRKGEQSRPETPREQALLLTQGHKTIVSGFNIAVKLDAGDENYDPQNETIQMHFYYPKNPSTKVTELNMNDEEHVVTYVGYRIIEKLGSNLDYYNKA